MKIGKIETPLFNLEYTLNCGQTFAWGKAKDWYYSIFKNHWVKVKQKSNYLIFNSDLDCTNFLRWTFRFDDKLEQIYLAISKDKFIKTAIENLRGLRVMREQPFECLISYICSANSNIPNIKQMMDNLCKNFGRRIEFDDLVAYSFPTPEKLATASLNKIKSCKLGFRARYVQKASRLIANKKFDLYGLKNLNYAEAKQKLMKLPGVREKIADCTLLFAFGELQAFPIDVWIRRAMIKNYFNGQRVSDETIRSFALNYFGKYAGYAQEYLFYWERINK